MLQRLDVRPAGEKCSSLALRVLWGLPNSCKNREGVLVCRDRVCGWWWAQRLFACLLLTVVKGICRKAVCLKNWLLLRTL